MQFKILLSKYDYASHDFWDIEIYGNELCYTIYT